MNKRDKITKTKPGRAASVGFIFDNTYARLPEVMFSRQKPVPVRAPEMIILNKPLAAEMGLDFSGMSPDEQATLFAGNQLPEGAEPIAQAYAGHQFGQFTMLGDGRAVIWGEHVTPFGERMDIQYKGSGRTPYSRRGDGRAVLGPMLREYIISEALHALGIPSTRSLAVAKTGKTVMRDTALPGAVLTRVASSHIRVGTFEYVAAQQDKALTQAMLDYTIKRHYPALAESDNKALALLKAVMARQADLIVHWMRVGFIHGVMNTDNMALSGETIDYGPCAFMNEFDPGTVFSSIDVRGRYAYANQPVIAQWNLARFAETLLPLLHKDIKTAVEMAEEAVESFGPLYQDKWLAMMRSKIGLHGTQKGDEKLIGDLLYWMHERRADYINTFRDLIAEDVPMDGIYQVAEFRDWHKRWQRRLAQNGTPLEGAFDLMRSHNPAVIPRNHKVEEALKSATEGDLEPLCKLLDALSDPYNDRPALKLYQSLPTPEERVHQTFCGT